MAAIKRASNNALERMGEFGTEQLVMAEKDSDVTHRLRDSFSWATIKKESNLGTYAESTDAVEKPKEAYTVNIGTNTPYAASVNYGTIGNFKYGVNGAPANFAELLREIRKWLEIKVSSGAFRVDPGTKIHDLAFRIAKDIEENGTDKHEFWEPAIKVVRKNAKEILEEALAEEFAKIPDSITKTEVVIL